jgi:hypothetical protein
MRKKDKNLQKQRKDLMRKKDKNLKKERKDLMRKKEKNLQKERKDLMRKKDKNLQKQRKHLLRTQVNAGGIMKKIGLKYIKEELVYGLILKTKNFKGILFSNVY